MKKKYNVVADCRGMWEQEIVSTILENRGIKDVEHFLVPVDDDLIDVWSMQNMESATLQVINAIKEDKKIAILFDVDVDGITSGTIIYRYLIDIAYNLTDNPPKLFPYINQGKKHGLTDDCIETFIATKADMVIIPDSLNSSLEEYKRLVDNGIEVVVLDHHDIDENVDYDSLITLVSSNRNDYKNNSLSGAGVSWKFCKACDEMLVTDFADKYVDLAACGILADVCDVNESNYENRYIVYKGLNNLTNLALKTIIGNYEFNSKAVLFSVAPLVNACTRVGNNTELVIMFLEDDVKAIKVIKKKLEGYKEYQKQLVEELLVGIEDKIAEQTQDNVFKLEVNIIYGVSGLIGNKLLDMVKKPVFVFNRVENGTMYGSMRAVGYDNFKELCNSTELCELHGHENASGIEVKIADKDKFYNSIEKLLDGIECDTSEEEDIDAVIEMRDFTSNLVNMVSKVNFVSGNGFKPLKFKVVGMNDYEVSSFKQGLHLVLKDTDDTHMMIEWNTDCDYEALEDEALFNTEIVGYGELESGFIGRSFKLKLILSDYELV